MSIKIEKPIEKACLVGLAKTSRERTEVNSSLDELAELTLSAGAKIDDSVVQVRRPDPKYYIGKGLMQKLKEEIAENGTSLVIFDDPLSPAQQRNLEKEFEIKVIDRSILILNIFAQHARTAESMLQVELAQLEYMLPRLTGAWSHLSRHAGGIGTRGPGETQLETDRRQVRKKIALLKQKLARVGRQRDTQRSRRKGLFKVALIGYTNAGKSTLFNTLTKSSVMTANQLFTTLDSTSRVMSQGFPDKIIFTDTVGFIKKLPHQLVEAFKSTLEEVVYADLLLHVVDITDIDTDSKIAQTESVLEEIGAGEIETLLIYNKIDKFKEDIIPTRPEIEAFLTSAINGDGLDKLKEALTDRLRLFSGL